MKTQHHTSIMLQSQPLLFWGSLSPTLLWYKRWSEESQKNKQQENHLGIWKIELLYLPCIYLESKSIDNDAWNGSKGKLASHLHGGKQRIMWSLQVPSCWPDLILIGWLYNAWLTAGGLLQICSQCDQLHLFFTWKAASWWWSRQWWGFQPQRPR